MNMGEGVVIVVRGGVVQGIASNTDVEVTLVDFDNIHAGDPIPELPDGMRYASGGVEMDKGAQVKPWKWLDF